MLAHTRRVNSDSNLRTRTLFSQEEEQQPDRTHSESDASPNAAARSRFASLPQFTFFCTLLLACITSVEAHRSRLRAFNLSTAESFHVSEPSSKWNCSIVWNPKAHEEGSPSDAIALALFIWERAQQNRTKHYNIFEVDLDSADMSERSEKGSEWTLKNQSDHGKLRSMKWKKRQQEEKNTEKRV